MGSDTRFQLYYYLFYALSMTEYYEVNSTIAACGKKVESHDGMVDDLHLNLRYKSELLIFNLYSLVSIGWP